MSECAGCFKNGKPRRDAYRDIWQKAQVYATRKGENMYIYLVEQDQEYKFATKSDVDARGLLVHGVAFP